MDKKTFVCETTKEILVELTKQTPQWITKGYSESNAETNITVLMNELSKRYDKLSKESIGK